MHHLWSQDDGGQAAGGSGAELELGALEAGELGGQERGVMNLSRNLRSLLEAAGPALELGGQVQTRTPTRTRTPRLTARVRRGLAALGKSPAAPKDLAAAKAWLASHGL